MSGIKLAFLAFLLVASVHGQNKRPFPKGFLFGTATSAYQVEGSWNSDDKGENIWDTLTHNRPELVDDRTSGDVACDSYRQYKRDVEMLKEVGVDFYRFSLSWTRILPTGFDNKISKAGIDYYNNLIDALLAEGITPMVTLYHWDLPESLQMLGGWANPIMEKYFEDYSRVCYEAFGDRVKTWLTFNEPKEICFAGYGWTGKAPALNFQGVAEYLCGHTLLKAHATSYRLYDTVFRKTQKGRVALTLSALWIEPASESAADKAAADRVLQFEVGEYSHPIFSKTGDYPTVMKERIAIKSWIQGFSTSRLPSFTPEEIAHIRGTYDFFGLNHYSTRMASEPTSSQGHPVPSFNDDLGVNVYNDPSWPTGQSDWVRVVPWGFRKMLNWIKDSYDNPEVIILENGYSDAGGVEDTTRMNYFRDYMNAMLDAMDDGCNVTAYTAWSLMDNMEWLEGYNAKFGLFSVNFDDPNRARTAKLSAKYFSDIIKNRAVDRV